MKAYQKASESSEKMDEKLSPLLKRLKHENRELRDKADLLKQKLEAIEKLNSKKVKSNHNLCFFFNNINLLINLLTKT